MSNDRKCDARLVKVKPMGLTAFQARCHCGWNGPVRGRAKASTAAEIHNSGGLIVGYDIPDPVKVKA